MWWAYERVGPAGRTRPRCAPPRKSILVLLAPLLTAVMLLIYLRPSLDAFDLFDLVRSPHRNQEPELGIPLHPGDHVSREATTQKFLLVVTKSLLSPDGVEKQVFQINGQFPGPTIEARSGDVLEVEVMNQSDESIAMHWHGLHMRGANDMDGPVGVTQCAIPPGKTFTYIVPVGEQAGTFWYHAHAETHRGDGLYGGLVVHEPASSKSQSHQKDIEYDAEMLLMVGDWYHPQSVDVLAKFMSTQSEGFEPGPDSMLVNGIGKFECSNAVPVAPVNCTEVPKPFWTLDKGKRYRLRIVNVGSMTGITVTVPDATMEVITVDGGLPLTSKPAASVGVLYPAERMDLVVSWEKAAQHSDSLLRIELNDEYFMEPNHALTPDQSFAIISETGHSSSSTEVAASSLFDLRKARGVTLPKPLPEPDRKFMIWSVVEVLDHNHGIPQGVVNRTSWQPQASPLLTLAKNDWDENQLVSWTGSQAAWIELTINNIDGTGHPFHLHGHDFYVVGSHEGNGGWDYYNPFQDAEPRGGAFNLVDPLQKDTVYVPPYGYVVLRFLADNEGLWALHCHIMWHQASGMSMAFQVLGDEERGLSDSAMASRTREQCEVWSQP